MAEEAFSNLMQNRQFLSLLSGAGAAIGAGGAAEGETSFAAGLNPYIQQTLAAQSKHETQKHYIETLRAMLAKGGKINLDAENISIKAPASSLAGPMEEFDPLSRSVEGGGTPGPVTSAPTAKAPITKAAGGLSSEAILMLLNPSSSPLGDLTASDLAGLTPQDVSRALASAIGVVELPSKLESRAGLLDYYRQLGRAAEARAGARTPLEETYPIDVPDVGRVSLRQWQALPLETKSYAAYVHQSKRQAPDEPVMTQEEWAKETDEDTKLAYLRGLADDPELKALAVELKTAGATRIGLPKQLDIKAKKWLTDPKGLPVAIDKHVEEAKKSIDYIKLLAEDDPKGHLKSRFIREKTVAFIEGRITGMGGSIVSVKMDGRTRVWTIKWPDKSESEVRYAF